MIANDLSLDGINGDFIRFGIYLEYELHCTGSNQKTLSKINLKIFQRRNFHNRNPFN